MRSQQFDFSKYQPSMFERAGRERKAKTMLAVLSDVCQVPLIDLDLLDVGASTGIIDNLLAERFGTVRGLDIDASAVEYAQKTYKKGNLNFEIGNAMELHVSDKSFDVVVCSQVYEHVPSAERMMKEIYRVLKPGGICYFAANNRFRWNEPHYNLPLLSAVPRWFAHIYIRLSGKAERYHELHYSYWGLKQLVRDFHIVDYTNKIISDPEKFAFEYQLVPGSLKQKVAKFFTRNVYCLVPGYIWVLKKPDSEYD
jgi:ubiquinone/menaquinone biosynthesis C-methylase UbiE